MTKIEIAVIAGLFALLTALTLTAYAAIAEVRSAPAAAASVTSALQPDPSAVAAAHNVRPPHRYYHPCHHRRHAKRTRESRAARAPVMARATTSGR